MLKTTITRLHEYLRFTADRFPALTVLVLLLAGIVFWGGFNTSMEATNTEQFCISCHAMRDNIYPEYKNSVHYLNSSGVRASCPDCHVPRDWIHKFTRKIIATNELYYAAMGSINSPEKFRARRLHLAGSVWTTLRDSDSRECRNCHQFEYMGLAGQGYRARVMHEHAIQDGKTCIECHKGLVHQLPDGYKDPEYEQYINLLHVEFEQDSTGCYRCHEGMAHAGWDD